MRNVASWFSRFRASTAGVTYRELATPEAIRAELLAQQEGQAAPLQVAAVWACVNLLSTSVASLPVSLYRRKDDRLTLAEDHPVNELLAVAPNSISTPGELMQLVMTHVLLKGNFYAEKVVFRDQTTAILPLFGQMSPKMTPDGRLIYEYEAAGKPKKTYAQEQILHVRGLTTDGLTGLSVLGAARRAIDGAIATENYGRGLFQRGARPSGVLQIDTELSEEAQTRLRNQFDDLYSGVENSHKTMLLEAGMKWAPISMNAEDTQFIESRKFSRSEIAMFFGVPPHLIGDIDRGTSWGSGIEQQNRGFLIYTLRGHLTRIAQTLRRDLLAPKERAKYIVKFDTSDLERADFGPRQAGLEIMRRNGVINANEWRKAEGLNPRTDEAADDYQGTGQAPGGPQEPAREGQPASDDAANAANAPASGRRALAVVK